MRLPETRRDQLHERLPGVTVDGRHIGPRDGKESLGASRDRYELRPVGGHFVHRLDVGTVRDLRIETIIVVNEWERRVKQTVALDVDIGTDLSKAATSHSVEHTPNYKTVAKRLMAFVGTSELQLVLTFA